MRLIRMSTVLAIAALSPGCTGASPAPADGIPVVGAWGGRHAALTLTNTGGAIEYDCAHGGLAAPIRLGIDGRFDVRGVHIREHGGPVRIEEPVDSVPARYIGRIMGDRMTLRVIVDPDTLGPFELKRDGAPQLLKCL